VRDVVAMRRVAGRAHVAGARMSALAAPLESGQTGVNTETTAWWTIAEVLVGCSDK